MTRDQRIMGIRQILVPLLLLLLALWQGQRADVQRTEALQFQGELHRAISEVQQLQAQGSREDIQVGERRYSPALAEAMFELNVRQAKREQRIAQFRSGMTHFSLGFSALLLVLGVAALLTLRAVSKAALQSRERLVRLFDIGRQVLPTVLVASVLLLTLTVVLEIAYEALWFFTWERQSSGWAKLQGAVGVMLLFMLWPLYLLPRQMKAMGKLFQAEPHPIFGASLTEAHAPALWARVRSLAAEVDALVPDQIVVGFLDGFYVTSSEVELSPGELRLHGRTLYVPLPLLALLDRGETDAVIGHELAHFSGKDTDYGIRFVPIYDGAWHSVAVLRERMEGGFAVGLLTLPAHDLAVHFMRCFEQAVGHWSRSRELLADATAARLAGPQAVVDSLVRTAALGPAVEGCLEAWHQDPDNWPQDVLQALLQHLAAQPPQLPPGELDEALPHPTDSHPPTIQRIQALGLGLEDALHGQGLRPVRPDTALACAEQALPGASELSRQLSTLLSDRLIEVRTQVREDLAARVDAVQGSCVLYEGGRRRGRLVLGIASVFVAGAAWLWLWPHGATAKPALLTFFNIIAAVLGTLAALLAVLGWRLIHRADVPALVLDGQAMRFANSAQPLPLHHIEACRVLTGTQFAVAFKVADDVPLPVFHKRRFSMPDARFDAKRRIITLQLVSWYVDGEALKAQGLTELVGRYLEAGHAQYALAEMEGRVPVGETAAARYPG